MRTSTIGITNPTAYLIRFATIKKPALSDRKITWRDQSRTYGEMACVKAAALVSAGGFTQCEKLDGEISWWDAIANYCKRHAEESR